MSAVKEFDLKLVVAGTRSKRQNAQGEKKVDEKYLIIAHST